MQNELRAKGFSGFITFQELIKDSTLIPSQKGVYIVLRENIVEFVRDQHFPHLPAVR